MTVPSPIPLDSAESARAQLSATHGPTDWVQITQSSVDEFAEATGDHQWIHVDPDKAKSGPFGSTIAHGFLTLSMIPTFLPQIFDLSAFSMAINYGLDRVRFITPVPVGSRLRATAEITDVQELTDAVQLKFLVTIEAEGAEKPSCVATFIARQYL
jgi:acyl dehydratase